LIDLFSIFISEFAFHRKHYKSLTRNFLFHSRKHIDTGGKNDFGRKKQPVRAKKDRGENDANNDGAGRNNRKASLRIGTGRKGRGAELSQRRGSLKKRDRSAQKARREEAAMERRTVNLPE